MPLWGGELPVVRQGGHMNPSQLVQKLLRVFQGGLTVHLHGAGLSRTFILALTETALN